METLLLKDPWVTLGRLMSIVSPGFTVLTSEVGVQNSLHLTVRRDNGTVNSR